MRFTYVYDAVYPYIMGGVERRVWELSRRLAGRGHDVHLYGMQWWAGDPDIEREGVHLHGTCRRDITIIPNGIDLEEIDEILPAEVKSDIIFVGRLIREKHLDVLVDAIGILRQTSPGLRCLVIGDGPERKDLEEKVNMMNLSGYILFTGFFKRSEDMIAHMKSSRVFVIPSTRERYGISALEALAAGLPVVTVDQPKNASRDFVRNGYGALAALDKHDLAKKIREVLERGKNKEIGKTACEYDWEVINDRIEKYYVGIAERRSRSKNNTKES